MVRRGRTIIFRLNKKNRGIQKRYSRLNLREISFEKIRNWKRFRKLKNL